MPEKRYNYEILIVGKKKSGKTTCALKLADNSPMKTIVVTTDRHPAYEKYNTLSVGRLKRLDNSPGVLGKHICYVKDKAEANAVAEIINKQTPNTLAIFEDAAKYVDSNICDQFEGLVINHRQQNIDIAFMFHALKFVPPKIAGFYDLLFLFKTADGGVNLSNKYGNWDYINKRRAIINQHTDLHYCECIKDYEA